MGDTYKNNDNIILRIEGTDIKIEDSDVFEESYYSFEYERAFNVLRSILNTEKSNAGMAYKNRDRFSNDESYNIIAFVGPRGSGKSSAMESFASALHDIHKKRNPHKDKGVFSNIYKELSNYYFYALPSIDGSRLEPKEDIFKITLGQMYGELVRLNENVNSISSSSQRILDVQKREVQESFVKLYRSACMMDAANGNIEEATITNLKGLSNSLKLRKDFRILVEQYLELICKMGNFSKGDNHVIPQNRHLVISIDDLDMNIRNGYQMLEKIHRYLMVPGVIVLMSMDLIQLKMLCEGSFYWMVPRVNKILKQRQKHISKLATEYTDKVLPIGSRIYMPDFKHRTNLRIFDSDIFDIKEEKSGGEVKEPSTLKEYFLRTLYKKSGMRFDHRGVKWHFYIPETMRGTANFYLMLNQLDNFTRWDSEIRKWDENDWTVFESNYNYLLGDIRSRMAVEKLDTKQYEQFLLWSDNQLERTCMTVVKHVSNLAKRGNDEEKERLEEFRQDYLHYEYSYGELLRSLYLWGRADNSNKKIVHCILADLTAEMTRSYYKMLDYDCGSDAQSKNPYRETLSFILNGSMLGSWSNRMLPAFDEAYLTSFNGNIGALRNVLASRIRFNYNISQIAGDSPKQILKGRTKKRIEECRKLFRTMEFFALFFTERNYKNFPTMTWRIDSLDNEDENLSEREIQIIEQGRLGQAISKSSKSEKVVYFKDGYPAFNMYGFMANLFDWEERSNILEQTFYNCLFSTKKTGGSFDKIDVDTRDDFLERIGVRNELKNWYNSSAGFVLPFYSVDITYNILKRMRQDRYGHRMTPKNARDIFKYFQSTLEKIHERLLKSDEFYTVTNKWGIENRGEIGICSSFAERFSSCPFVKWALKPECYLVDNFYKMFEDMLKALVSSNESDSMLILTHTIENEMDD